MTLKRSWIAVGAVGVAGTAAVAVAVVSSGGSDAQTTTATSSAATTKIVVQDLEERESVDGTLGYSDARPVVNRLAGTVTWTPRLGSVVETNHKLYEVDGDAVYLLNGAYPAYRTLTAGLKGDDVVALERNLRALGLDSGHDMSVDGTWDAGTTAAVKRWQRRKGLDDTGTIEKGRIVFQPGARRIGSIALAAGQSASGGGGGGSNAPASTTDTAPAVTNASLQGDGGDSEPTVAMATVSNGAEPQVNMVLAAARTQATTPDQGGATTPDNVQDTTPDTTPDKTTPDKTKPGKSKPDQTKPDDDGPKGTDAKPSTGTPGSGSGGVPSGAPSGGSGGAPSGGSGAPSGGSGGASTAATGSSGAASSADVSATVMTTTSVKRIVAVDLEATKQALAKRGAKVSVEMPDGKDVPGTIATVSAVAVKKATAGDEDPPATVKLVIKLTRSAGTGLDQAPVDVQLTQSRAKDVLTVPVTALIAQQGGKFAVEVREGTGRRIVEVETGLYTDSYVEIEGQGLRAGMAVTNARV